MAVFAGKKVTPESARSAFREQQGDARALCFFALLSEPMDKAALYRSADLGYAFAQAAVAQDPEESSLFALNAAKGKALHSLLGIAVLLES